MFKADARRIDWFLDLSHILHFTRTFIAPVRTRNFGVKVASHDADATTRRLSAAGNQAKTFAQQRSIAANSLLEMKRATPTNNSVARTALLRLLTKEGPRSPAGPSGTLPPPTPSAFRLTNQHTSKHIEAATRTRGELPSPPKRYSRAGMPADRPLSPDMSFSLAPRLTFTAERANPDRAHNGRPRSATADLRGTVAAQNLLSTPEESSSSGNTPRGKYSSSPDQIGAADDESRQNHKLPVSTIHIDGSVLGRWAIQYLERALGKPATGMTGVDPRAATPRSRVAPY